VFELNKMLALVWSLCPLTPSAAGIMGVGCVRARYCYSPIRPATEGLSGVPKFALFFLSFFFFLCFLVELKVH
jgi:hypothetical protein